MARHAQATTAALALLIVVPSAAAEADPSRSQDTGTSLPKLELDRARYRVIRSARLAALPRRGQRPATVKLLRTATKRARRPPQRPRPAARPMALHPPRAVGWGGGEALTYRIRLLGIEIARAGISVGRPRGRQLQLRGRGETIPFVQLLVPLQEELVTRLDLDGMRPLRTTSRRREGDRRRKIDTVHRRWTADPRKRAALVEQTVTRTGEAAATTHRRRRPIAPPRTRRRRLAGPVVDPLTALQIVRSAPLSPKHVMRLYVLDGTALFEIELRLAGKDRLHTALGPRDCLRVEGVGHRIHDDGRRIKGKRVRRGSIWLSANSGRVPVRLEGDTKFGFVNADITSYQAPRQGVVVRLPNARPVPLGGSD